MALIGINQPRGKAQGKDTLDRIAQALQIAQGVLGVGLAVPEYLQKKKANEQAAQMAERQQSTAEVKGLQPVPMQPVPEGQAGPPAPPLGGVMAPKGSVYEGQYVEPRSLTETDPLKKLRLQKMIRDEEKPTDDQLDQFEEAFPGKPIPKTRGELLSMTKALESQKIREERAHKLGQEAQQRISVAEENLDIRKSERVDRKVERLSKQVQVSGIGPLEDKMDQIFEIINAPRNKGDIPGFGRGESLIPTKLTTGDANKLRRLVASFKNITLKARSGAAVTAPEMTRFLEEVGSGAFESEESLLNGLNQLKRSMEVDRAQIFAGYPQETIEAFKTRADSLLPGIGGDDDVESLLNEYVPGQ